LNDLFRWAQENWKLMLGVLLVLVVLSSTLGFIFGTLKKRSREQRYSLSEIEKGLPQAPEGELPGVLLPAPVVPSFSFYFELTDPSPQESTPPPVRVSELLRYRDRGVESDVRAFRFESEEFEVLTKKEELAEP
jgi:hypothetical protein